jgi:hypothetical protein
MGRVLLGSSYIYDECMYACMYVCMYVCMYDTYTRMYACTCVYTYVYVCTHVYTYVCNTYMPTDGACAPRILLYICMYVYTYVCIKYKK